MPEKKNIDDYFPECKGKENAKMSPYHMLWICGANPLMPCSKRYTIEEYKGKYFCKYIIFPKQDP